MQELENGEHGCTAEHIQWSIVNAFSGESNLSDGNLGSDILNILGFTSPKVKHLLSNICNFWGYSINMFSIIRINRE